ncbi:MAG: phage minor head protein [Alphaproteobacteria bacterium]
MPHTDIIHTQAYRRAFDLYLRKGIPIELSLKAAAEHPTTHYIWRTRGDNKVRASHAANNGRIFAWDDPPVTGHPGEDFGCRCWAQPYRPADPEYLDQSVTSKVQGSSTHWEWYDFVIHYYFGGGEPVQLSDIGHLQDVINQANEHGLRPHQVFEGVEIQVLKATRAARSGAVSGTFTRGYDFSSVSFVHGESEVYGNFAGTVQQENDYLIVTADVDFEFSDEFEDPLDIIQGISSNVIDIHVFIGKLAAASNLSIETLMRLFRETPYLNPDDIYDWIKWLSKAGGSKYRVTGKWKTALHGYVYKDAENSKYPKRLDR